MKGLHIMENIKGAIFDLDGVIVDTAKYHYLAWKRLAKLLDINFTEIDNEKLKGVSRIRSLEIILELGGISYDDEEKKRLAAMKNEWYVEYITRMDQSEFLKGAKEYLVKLKNNNVKISLGSASKNAMMILDNLKIKDLFDSIIDGNKVIKAKPDPEVFLLGAKEMSLSPPDCAVFEDSISGIEAAKIAGMKTIGIGNAKILKNADLVIKDLYEML